MKIVRVVFSLGSSNKEYFIDRPYDEHKDDQVNCDDNLGFLIGSIKDGDAIAVMKEVQKRAQPVILNLKNIAELNVLNIAVYQVKPPVDGAVPIPPGVPPIGIVPKEQQSTGDQAQ